MVSIFYIVSNSVLFLLVKALVTSSDALVTSSLLFLILLFLIASCYY